MRRREFLPSSLATVAVAPVQAYAQHPRRLAFLGPTLNNPPAIAQYQAFHTQLGDLGFREGKNLIVDYRALDDPGGPYVMAAGLVRSHPDLIVAAGPETAVRAGRGAAPVLAPRMVP